MANISLIYNAHPINERGEMLSLTDMWRAAGGADEKRPNDWKALPSTVSFVEYLETTTGKSGSELIQALNEGGTWNTWAHWQIGMAYAKYLSPEFHAWCNQVVRDHMERRGVPVQATPAVISISDEAFREMMRPMTAGITALLEGQKRTDVRLTNIESTQDWQGRAIKELYEQVNSRRKRIKDSVKTLLIVQTEDLGGRCPCCGVSVVAQDRKRANGAEFDHFYANSAPDADHVWLICRDCHADLTRHVAARDERNAEFQAFQAKRRRLPGAQIHLIEVTA